MQLTMLSQSNKKLPKVNDYSMGEYSQRVPYQTSGDLMARNSSIPSSGDKSLKRNAIASKKQSHNIITMTDHEVLYHYESQHKDKH